MGALFKMSAPTEATYYTKMSSTKQSLLTAKVLLLLTFIFSFSKAEDDFYSFTVTDIKGYPVSLEKYRGKYSLVVNVASACGYTNQHYSELTWLEEQKDFENLNILAFPCNQFGQQETSMNHIIEKYARTVYGAKFPMFAKTEVIGENVNPVYKYLAESSGKEPTWNFWKYLVSPEGKVLNAWGPKVTVLDLYSQLYNAAMKAKKVANAKEKKINKKEEEKEVETKKAEAIKAFKNREQKEEL